MAEALPCAKARPRGTRQCSAYASTEAPKGEQAVRWTPGLAFAVTKPKSVDIISSAKARFHSINLSTVAAWKRDRITERNAAFDRQRVLIGRMTVRIPPRTRAFL